MNQYERANAVHSVEGYDLRLMPRKPREVEFDDAKSACLRYMRDRIAHIEELTFEQYVADRKELTLSAATSGAAAEKGQNNG